MNENENNNAVAPDANGDRMVKVPAGYLIFAVLPPDETEAGLLGIDLDAVGECLDTVHVFGRKHIKQEVSAKGKPYYASVHGRAGVPASLRGCTPAITLRKPYGEDAAKKGGVTREVVAATLRSLPDSAARTAFLESLGGSWATFGAIPDDVRMAAICGE